MTEFIPYSIEEAELSLLDDEYSDTKKYRVARWVSHILSPPILFSLTLYFLGMYTVDRQGAKWATYTLLLAALPPTVFVKWLVRKGKLSDFYMQQREERIKPIIFITGWGMFSLVVLWLMGAPSTFCKLIAAAIFQMCVLGAITLFWKISFHGASAASVMAIVLTTIGNVALILLPLVMLVGWARVYMRRHTKYQVLIGSLMGFVLSFIIFALVMSLA